MDALYEMAARLTPDFEKKLTAALGGLKRFNADRKALLGEIAKRPLLAFEYLNQRDPTLPDVSTYRLIYEQQMGRTRADITANVSASIFNSVSGAMQGTPVRDRWRDFQFSGQADIPLGRRGGCTDEQASMNPVLTISALAERLRERTPVSFAGFTLEAEKGTIAVAQAKLTIPWGGTGVKVPISFSIANRTELIHEKKELRANIGVTFDFDSVAALFKR
jgi:hypothetical protein